MSVCNYPLPFYNPTEFLYDSCVFSGGESGEIFALGAGADHFAGTEDKRRRPRLPNPHDHRREPLRIVLGVPRVQRDFLLWEVFERGWGEEGGWSLGAAAGLSDQLKW